jgi:hypothetical protein
MNVCDDRPDSPSPARVVGAITDGGGPAGKTISPMCAQPKAQGWTIQCQRAPGLPPRTPLHGNRGTRLTLLSYQVAETRQTGSAAAKCSSQTDLRLTFIDPI